MRVTSKKYKFTTARQEDGDDGYCWVIRVHGEKRMEGLHTSEVAHYREKFEEEEAAKLIVPIVTLPSDDDHYNDPPAELMKTLLEKMSMQKLSNMCHNYGKGDNAFCDKTYRRTTREVTKVLRDFGYQRDIHQFHGHTNYIHPVRNQLAQVYTDGKVCLVFLTLPTPQGVSI